MISGDLYIIRQYQIEHKQPCDHEDCNDLGMPCYLSPTDEEPEAHYCAIHAPEHGFCLGCNEFKAGDQAFDHSRFGLCGDCEDKAMSESKPPLAEVLDDNDPYLWIDYDG